MQQFTIYRYRGKDICWAETNVETETKLVKQLQKNHVLHSVIKETTSVYSTILQKYVARNKLKNMK